MGREGEGREEEGKRKFLQNPRKREEGISVQNQGKRRGHMFSKEEVIVIILLHQV
jgi:hypothetical protein